jgi:NodT family efflux transporter outer membrane factor (OMF) lipoprotein
MSRSITTLVGILGVLLMEGCTLGPDFTAPATPLTSSFVDKDRMANASVVETDIADPWWAMFNDPILSSLEDRVAQSNFGVKIASTRLLQSRAERHAVGASQYPSLDAGASYSRQRSNPDGPNAPPSAAKSSSFDVFEAGFDSAWELDLWGRIRRSVEAADSRYTASAESRRFVLIAVEAEVAHDYLALRGSQTLLQILQDNLEIAESSVKLTRSRFLHGVTTGLDVANAEAQVDAIQANIPTVEAERDRLINALSLLLALPPHTLQDELKTAEAIPAPPQTLSIGIPSDLVRRRPDVRQAEAELHAATAEVGVAEADFYPRISLTGSLGGETLQLADLGWSSRQLAVGPLLSLPIFEGGRLQGALDLRNAQQMEAAVHFQEVVLTAWHEADNALTDYFTEQRRHEKLRDAVHQNEDALALAQRRYRAGAIDFLNVLSVQKTLLEARSALARGDVAICDNLVRLYKALGGGWSAQFPQTAPAVSKEVWSLQ